MFESIWHWGKLTISAATFGFAGAHIIENGILFWQDAYSRWVLGATILLLLVAFVASAWSAIEEWVTEDTEAALAVGVLSFYAGKYMVAGLETIGQMMRSMGIA